MSEILAPSAVSASWEVLQRYSTYSCMFDPHSRCNVLGRPPKKRIITLTLNRDEPKKEPVPVTPAAAPSPATKEEKEEEIPADASKWTPSQVEAYFKKHGLKEEGLLFREQV